MKDENVFRKIFFSFIHPNSSNFTVFSMKGISRSYLVYVSGFRRVFHWHLELLSTFLKIFFLFLIDKRITNGNIFPSDFHLNFVSYEIK